MSNLRKTITLGLLTGVLGLLVSLVHFGTYLEEGIGLGLLFQARGERQPPADVVVVALDQESAHHLNLPRSPEKWPRAYHAKLVETLAEKGASVIVFDINFRDESEQDALFAEAIRRAQNVVLLEYIEGELIPLKDQGTRITGEINIDRLVPPTPVLAREAVALGNFSLPKVPAAVSQYWTFKDGSEDFPTLPVDAFQLFALQGYDDLMDLLRRVLNRPEIAQASLDRINRSFIAAAQTLLSLKKEDIISDKRVQELIGDLKQILGNNTFISELMLKELEDHKGSGKEDRRTGIVKALIEMYKGGNSHYLNFYGPPRTIKTVPYWQVLKQSNEVGADPESVDFKGKAVFVGSSESLPHEQRDGFPTAFTQPNGLELSGIEICATAFANLLERFPIQPLRFPIEMLSLLILGIALGMICFLLPPAIAMACSAGLTLSYVCFAYYQFKTAGIWFPVMVPTLIQLPFAMFGTVLWKYVDSNQERKMIRKAFGHYVPDTVIDRLSRSLGELRKDGQLVHGTCLYADVENYTALSENMDPESLRELLNDYYEAIFAPIKQQGGIVLGVKGDSMLAIWATGKPDHQLQAKACNAAIDVTQIMDHFNGPSGYPKLHARIGLHSGMMLLGNVGGGTHYEYTAMGDIINTASRIEGLNKYLGTRLLVSEEVVTGLDGFMSRELGTFLLVGKLRPMVVYELMGRVGHSTNDQRRLCAKFSAAINAYRMQCWLEASDGFSRILTEHDTDGPSLFYLNLCNQLKENYPSDSWDGVIRLDKK